MAVPAPLVLVTSIPRTVMTALGVAMANATVNQRFGALISAAGGIPVASDAWGDPEPLLERVDAVVVNGGSDVDPERYGAEPHPRTDPPDPRRDAFEIGLVRAAVDRRLPVLGVCRGLHVLNVALGGSLLQHLPDVTGVAHYVTDRWDQPVHPVSIEPGTALAGAFGTSTEVNTVHHQAVDRLGAGLRVSARAPDGTVEAVEDADGFVIGVQWHPEFLAGELGDRQVALFRAVLQRSRAAAAA